MVTTARPAVEKTEETVQTPTIDLMERFLVHALKVEPKRRLIRRLGARVDDIAAAIIERSHRRPRKRQ